MWKFRCWEEYTDSGTVSAVWPGNKSHYGQFWSHLYMHTNDYTVLNVSSRSLYMHDNGHDVHDVMHVATYSLHCDHCMLHLQ